MAISSVILFVPKGKYGQKKTKNDPAALELAKKERLAEGKNPTTQDIEQRAQNNAIRDWGTGGKYQQVTQALTGALQGALGGYLTQALANGSALYLAEGIKNATTNPDGSVNTEANLAAHAILGALLTQANGNNAVAGGLTGDSSSDARQGAIVGKNAVKNNYLSEREWEDYKKKLVATCSANNFSCIQTILEDAYVKSLLNDKELNAVCMSNPSSDACIEDMRDALMYNANWKELKDGMLGKDMERSILEILATLMSMENKNATALLDNLNRREDFFQTMANFSKLRGDEVVWWQLAADVSSELDVKVNKMCIFCNNTQNWVNQVGNQILDDGWPEFKDFYNNTDRLTGDSAKSWDDQRLKSEQYNVQGLYAGLDGGPFYAIYVGTLGTKFFDIRQVQSRIDYGLKGLEQLRQQNETK